MKQLNMVEIPRMYANNGQHAEQVFRYTLTGVIMKADNRKGNDLGEYQIKSARATVGKVLSLVGESVYAVIDRDPATYFAYVTADFKIAYIMTKPEWREFCRVFATLTNDSHGNGYGAKWRLGHETKAMLEWFKTHLEKWGAQSAPPIAETPKLIWKYGGKRKEVKPYEEMMGDDL